MKVETRNILTNVYIAEDGVEFQSERSCIEYEEAIKATFVYTISPIKPYLLTARGLSAFSSRELAEAVLLTYARPYEYEIIPIQIDKELWRLDYHAKQYSN